MAWLIAAVGLFFAWISVSMYVAAFKESDPVVRNQLMKKGFGPMVLALMGLIFAWYSFNPPTEPPNPEGTTKSAPSDAPPATR